jgi:hypothetical protein
MMESFFAIPDTIKNKKEKGKEGTFLQEVFGEFSKYLNKKLDKAVVGIRNEYAGNLQIIENQKVEIRNALLQNRISPSGLSSEKLLEATLKVGAKFSQKEAHYLNPQSVSYNVAEESTSTNNESRKEERKTTQKEGIPLFITNRLRAELKGFGYSDEQIGKLKPEEAWEIFNKESTKDEKPYEPENIPGDVKVLHDMWEYAYDSLDNIVDAKRINELMDLTGNAGSDIKLIEDYITKESTKLKPEEKFFLEISIELKKFRSSAKKIAI